MKSIRKGRLPGGKLVALLFSVLLMFSLFTENGRAEEHYRVAGFGADFAPFNFADETGKLMGIDHDLMDAIAADQGFTVEKIDMPFNSALQAAEQGQVTGIMAGMSITPEREEVYDFSDPYFESSTSFASKEGAGYDTLEDLRGKKIAVKTGAMGAMIAADLKDEYDFSIVEYEDSSSMYQAVMTGNADAVVDETPVMQFAISTDRVALELVGDPQEPAPLGIAVPKGTQDEFLAKVNQGLENLKASGEYEEIISRYLGEEALAVEKESQSFFQQMFGFLKELSEGLKVTLLLATLALILGTILGTVIALARLSDKWFFSAPAGLYIQLIRGVPMIVLAFFIYFGIPQATGFKISEFNAGLLTITLNAGAYIAEIIRGGIQGIAAGQKEAAYSLGLSPAQTMQKVILPQALRLMLPSLLNQFVISLKDTSILSVIGIVELTQAGKIVIARTYQSGQVWLLVGLIYFVIISLLTHVANRLEVRLSRSSAE